MDKGKFVISAFPMRHTMTLNVDCSNRNFHNYLEAVDVFKILNFKQFWHADFTICINLILGALWNGFAHECIPTLFTFVPSRTR